MVLDKYRDGAGRAFAPVAVGLGRLGLTPDALTVASFAFATLAGAAFLVASPERPAWLLVAAAGVAANAILDALDGALARATNSSSKRGDYLDHVVDRYSDVAIAAGLALSPLADVRLGLLALVGTLMTSYMGTQAQALGLGRDYAGLLGRADRLVLLIAAPVVELAMLAFHVDAPVVAGTRAGALNALLLYFAIVGNLTALQRFAHGWRELSRGA